MTLGAGEAYVEGALPVQPREASVPSARAFAELYKAHFSYVWTSARRLGVAREDADDVVQEAFLTLHRILHEQEVRGSLHGLLFSIVFRIVQHQRRTAQRRRAMTNEVVLIQQTIEPLDRGPDTKIETAESLRILEEILEGLDPDKRAALILAELEERSLSEIAEILGITINAAASRVRRAREHVEASLARRAARDRRRLK